MSAPSHPNQSEIGESGDPAHRGHTRDTDPASPPHLQDPPGSPAERILFLDDDLCRAEKFLAQNPDATWVQTASDCIERLAEAWKEVHLDHDLGGEQYVDVEREDCGMEVVRWLCKEPRGHLDATRFIIHSHNLAAALMMVLLMRETGYNAEFLPFGFRLELDPFSPPIHSTRGEGADPMTTSEGAFRRFIQWVGRLLGRTRLSNETPENRA